jgi:CHAT domain-containing protein
LAYYEVNLKSKLIKTIDSLKLDAQIVDFSKSLKPSQRLKYSEEIIELAKLSLDGKQPKKARHLYEERLDVLRQDRDTLDFNYATALYGLSLSYIRNSKNKNRIERYLLQSLDIIKSKGPFSALNEIQIYKILVELYIATGDDEKVITNIQDLLSHIQNVHGKRSMEYAVALKDIGGLYYSIKNLSKVYDYEKQASEAFEAIDSTTNLGYLAANYYLAIVEEESNNYAEAINMYKSVQNVFVANENTGNPIYARVLGRIAINYDKSGDYANAIKYFDASLELPNITQETLSKRLMDKAFFYQNMGRYDKSKETYEKAKKVMVKALGEDHPEYAKLLANMGKLFFAQGKFDEALKYTKSGLDIIVRFEEKRDGQWHNFHSWILDDYSATLFELGETDTAIALMKENLAYCETHNKPKDEAYYNMQQSLAKAYNLTHQFAEAKPFIDSATDSIRLILGEDHEDYGQFLKIKSATYFGLQELDKGVNYLSASNDVFINQIDKIFRFSSENEQKIFLKTISKNFNTMQSLVFLDNIENKELNALNLNNQLILKGLLLNNSKGVFVDLKRLKNDSINKKIRNYKNSKKQLAAVLTESISQRRFNVDSLRQIINASESELVQIHSELFSESQTLVRNWKDIQAKLRNDEVVIEFSHYNPVINGKPTNAIKYVAYVFNSKSIYPKAIALCNQSEINAAITRKTEDQIYNSEELYNMIWKPLESELKNMKTVYYSPSGLLNQISLAALKNTNEPIIHDKQLVQMSSTHKLIESIDDFNIESSLLIGGVTYDYTENGIRENGEDLKNIDGDVYSYALSKSRGTKSRGESWTFLEGTVAEIENLNTLLSSSGVSVSLLSKENATEDAFKGFDGKSPNLIHIATHGYFYENNNSDISKQTNLSLEDQYRLAEDPLLRSGLIFAGANYAWRNNKKPKNQIEDGILTALEISNLDLSSTELVILSACKTGLGDIDGSEGVYGLQRGFKKAGVNRLIMSLWEVPDNETSEFMTKFYRNWLDSRSVRKAFVETQRQMASIYNDAPSKWAAFVLFE